MVVFVDTCMHVPSCPLPLPCSSVAEALVIQSHTVCALTCLHTTLPPYNIPTLICKILCLKKELAYGVCYMHGANGQMELFTTGLRFQH